MLAREPVERGDTSQVEEVADARCVCRDPPAAGSSVTRDILYG